MRKATHKRLLLALAAVAVLAGVTAAVVMAAQPSKHAGRHPSTGLEVAAAYLGTSAKQLRSQLRAGKSLAQVAQAEGRSVAGLTQALEAAARKRLQRAQANLPKRVADEVNRVRVPSLTATATGYLGITAGHMRRELRAGRTLAQLASSTPGRSEAGLVQALVAARKQALASALSAGRITQAHESRALAHVQARIQALVRRVHPGRVARGAHPAHSAHRRHRPAHSARGRAHAARSARRGAARS